MLLTAGLGALGILNRVNWAIGKMVARGDVAAVKPEALPDWMWGSATVVLAFGISWVVLSVEGDWRRLLVWITSIVITAGWAPVLGLAARAPDIGGPWIAVLWAGLCALVYAKSHQRLPRKCSLNDDHEAR